MFPKPPLALLQACALAWLALAAPASANNQDLVVAAREQVGVTVIYDGSYPI